MLHPGAQLIEDSNIDASDPLAWNLVVATLYANYNTKEEQQGLLSKFTKCRQDGSDQIQSYFTRALTLSEGIPWSNNDKARHIITNAFDGSAKAAIQVSLMNSSNGEMFGQSHTDLTRAIKSTWLEQFKFMKEEGKPQEWPSEIAKAIGVKKLKEQQAKFGKGDRVETSSRTAGNREKYIREGGFWHRTTGLWVSNENPDKSGTQEEKQIDCKKCNNKHWNHEPCKQQDNADKQKTNSQNSSSSTTPATDGTKKFNKWADKKPAGSWTEKKPTGSSS